MASADFSTALTLEISPGKVRDLSARAVGLYLSWLSVTVGLRGSQHAYRPRSASLSVPVRTVDAFGLPFLQRFGHPFRLGLTYDCCHSIRQPPLRLLDHAHAGHTGSDFSRDPPLLEDRG